MINEAKLYYSTFPSKVDKKKSLRRFLSATKFYPYKAWPRNLSAVSTTRNVACMYAHTPLRIADIWKKKYMYIYLDF